MDPSSAVPTSGKNRLTIWRAAGSLVSMALLVYLVSSQGWSDFLAVLGRLPLWRILVAAGLILVSRVLVTVRWFILLRGAGARLTFSRCLRLVFMGLFASNFLPSTVGGDVVRLAGAVSMRLDPAVSAASLLVDRLVGMAGMAVLLPIGLAAVLKPAGVLVEGAPISALLGSGILPLPGVRQAAQRLGDFSRAALRSSLIWLRRPLVLAWAFVFTFVHMTCMFLAIRVLLDGMQQPLSFWWIGGLWSLSYFVSLAPVSINGLGLQEVSIAYLYSQIGGASLESSLALAVVLRMLFLLSSLPGALFLPDIVRPGKKTGDDPQ